ncbi:MAG: beta-lactamase family protein [Pseudomonadota bacterium]|nr:beta-lactamase family protein [Pseudomonadota bacterium]
MRGLPTIVLCALCALLAGCGPLTTTELRADDIEASRHAWSDLSSEVDRLAAPLVESGHTPGLLVGVRLPDGGMRFFGYGVADERTGRPPDRDTLFAIGSLSKGYLGAVTALLVSEGRLSWSDTLRDLLPLETPLSRDAAQITVLQLATHTSGLPRQPLSLRTLRYFVEYLFDGENFYRHFTSDYLLNYLADFEADNPGRPQYSNIGYGLLSYVIERRTGQSAERLIEQKIISPLRLRCTGFVPGDLPCRGNRARGYAGDQPKFIARGSPVPDWSFTPVMEGTAGMYSNARDLLAFAAAHLQGHKTPLNAVLASDTVVRVPQPERAAAVSWIVDDVAGQPITYQIGIVGGYTSYLGMDTGNNTAVVVLQNSFNWDSSLGHKLLLSLRYGRRPTAAEQVPAENRTSGG